MLNLTLSRNTILMLMLGGVLLACWPSLVWYQARMTDGSDNNWGLFALAAAVMISLIKLKSLEFSSTRKVRFSLINVCLLAYLLSRLFSYYPLVQATLVAVAIASLLSQYSGQAKLNYGLLGLTLLGLPIFASLDFYFGYPLRYIIGWMSTFLLNVQGLGVQLEGVSLLFGDKIILIDGPCSGIKMMWAGSFLVFSFAAYFNLGFRQSLKLSVIAFTIVLIANVLRICALFYIESGIFSSLTEIHEAVGLVCYAMAVISILFFGLKLVNKPSSRMGGCNEISC